MKSFTDYVAQINRKYEFVVRIADCDINEDAKIKINSALSMYVVESIGAAKRLPIQDYNDFPSLGACEVHMLEVTLRYPTITPQIKQLIAERLKIAVGQVVVRTKLEEQQHEYVSPEPKKAKDGSLLNNPELESENSQHLVGNNRIGSLIKELESRKYQFAETAQTSKAADLSQNVKSPVGSNPVKHRKT